MEMEISMKYSFVLEECYSRKDVKRKIGHSKVDGIGGIWATGYASYNNCYFLFVNIATAGKTGHNYNNMFYKGDLYWRSKGPDTINSATIQNFLSGKYEVYIFTRENNKDVNFNFKGLGYVKDYEDTHPFHIVWGLSSSFNDIEKKQNKILKLVEGLKTTIKVNKYERNPKARISCLEYFGYDCSVCSMNFKDVYGEIGKEFIHVHHLKEISLIGEEYEVDPIKDLIPVCANCHAMLHKRKPAFSIAELKALLS